MKSLRLATLLAFAAAAVAIVLWVRGAENNSGAIAASPEVGEVEWVIDGDTIDLIIDGQQERVRLIGIDTPESVSRDTPVQCFGVEASTALKGLLPVGSSVRLVRDQESRDRFGRLLLYVYRTDDDLFVNEWMVANGFADTLFFEPNTTFQSQFIDLRNEARAAPVGLWANCDGPDQPIS